ncbi:hypothetical protein, partial [Paenibacillus elgii]
MASHINNNFILIVLLHVRNLRIIFLIPFISIWLFFELPTIGYANPSLPISYGSQGLVTAASISNGLYENIYDVESFERGSFTGTNYIAGAGTITNDPQKVIT